MRRIANGAAFLDEREDVLRVAVAATAAAAADASPMSRACIGVWQPPGYNGVQVNHKHANT